MATTAGSARNLCDPKALISELKTLQLAPSDVLDNATAEFKVGGKKEHAEGQSETAEISVNDVERAILLRELGNKLRIAGRLREAGEAFRRALNVAAGTQAYFEFARYFDQASARGVPFASRPGRPYDFGHAGGRMQFAVVSANGLGSNEALGLSAVNRASGLEPRSFERESVLPMFLRKGKLAMSSTYRDAAHAVSEKALIRYARREADYYVRLNDDDDYLSAELSRINWLQTLTHVRSLAARLTNVSVLVALIGYYADPTIASLGWALASSSLVAWLTSLLASRLLSQRRKPRPVD